MGLGVSSKFDNIGSGLDLESISEASTIAPEPASYETVYVTGKQTTSKKTLLIFSFHFFIFSCKIIESLIGTYEFRNFYVKHTKPHVELER